MSATEPSSRPRRLTAVRRDGSSVTPLELFFDLVFVLVLTQCTALMADHPTWEGLCQGLLILCIVWWSWVGYAWLTSVVDPEVRWRNIHTLNRQRLLCAILLVALLPLGVELPALATVSILAAIMVALITYETVRFAELRERIRHQLEPLAN